VTAAGEVISPQSPCWRQALSRAWHEVYQLPEYVSFEAERLGGQPAAFFYEDGDGIFLLPFVAREIPGTDRSDAVSPYGYPGPVSDRSDRAFWCRAVTSLVETLASEQLVSLFVRLDPLQPTSCTPLSEVGTLVTHGATICVDLRLRREEWWSQLRKEHREAINKNIRLGRTSITDDWQYLDDFVQIYRETMTRTNATEDYFFDREYFERLRNAVPDSAHLQMIFSADGEPIAGSVLLAGGSILQAHLAGSRPTQRREKSTPFLVHEAVQWGREHGCSTFQLGGGVGGREDSLFEFKKGFSPHRHDFQTFRAVLDAPVYRKLAVDLNPQADPEDLSAYFPLYRARPTQ
jgi:lipid II:glycine glycyltransferase (peptidoglycan interpeptide bridge formation enzyme)